MATCRVIARLTPEDVVNFRESHARIEAARINPNAFGAEETVKIVRDHAAIIGDIVERYEIDPASEWEISAWTGVVTAEI